MIVLQNRPGYINNSPHLARKYAGIFVRGHYLFREANFEEQQYVQGQINEHIFAPDGEYCVYYPSNGLDNSRQVTIFKK